MPTRARTLWIILALVLCAMIWASSRHPVEVILAESADQGLKAMIAVGEVIRERGSTRGFSVTRKDLARFYSDQPLSRRLCAEIAWPLSGLTRFSGSATHFENTTLFGDPPWVGSMRVTTRIRDLTFYREKTRKD